MIKRRARLKSEEEMPDWAKHCVQLSELIMRQREGMGSHPDGSFDIDISQIICRNMACGFCGEKLPGLRGYVIVSGEWQGYVIATSLIHIAEGEIDDNTSTQWEDPCNSSR